MSNGVLLLAHGTPDSLDEMACYLTMVRGGRPPSEELVAELQRNYGAIGGRSPLTDITRAQASALERALGQDTPVFVGMRNWRPFIADALGDAHRAGVTSLVALPLAPQYSELSVGKYKAAVESTRPPGVSVRFVESWHDHPGLIAAFAERVSAALAGGRADAIFFTAHSLPVRVVEAGDPYVDHVRTTAEGIAERLSIASFEIAYQSAGRTPEPWLGPSLEEALGAASRRGCARILVVPVSFVCDHTEILYDIDIQAQAAARDLGVTLVRSESLNTSELFIATLADIVRHHA
jgi:ferrochelatase